MPTRGQSQGAGVADPAGERPGGGEAGGARRLDDPRVEVAVRIRERRAGAVDVALDVGAGALELLAQQLGVERRQAGVGAGVRADLPAASASSRSSSQDIGTSSCSCGPPSHWSMPGQAIGRSLPAIAVGTKTVAGNPERPEHRRGELVSPSGRRRRR